MKSKKYPNDLNVWETKQILGVLRYVPYIIYQINSSKHSKKILT